MREKNIFHANAKRKDKLNGMKTMASNQEDMDVFDSWEQMDETEVLYI